MSTKKEQILQKIGKVKNYLRELIAFQKFSLEQITTDSKQKAALERFLYLTCDSSISLLEMLISYKDYPIATTYSENIDVLFEQKEISQDEAEMLHKIVGLRNILSHDYEKLDIAILKDIADNKLTDIQKLIEKIGKSLK